MDRCRNTGLTIPECSCHPCLRALLERHAPALAAKGSAEGERTKAPAIARR